jgi:tRNA nucleotidyltransferase (CCA-adding enzyme)
MSTNNPLNAAGLIPPALFQILRDIGVIAERAGMHAYLVGGAVRDSLLKTIIKDLDICVEGDAHELALQIESELNGEISMKSQFLTARVKVATTTIDISTCRDESYPAPGVLPVVYPSSLDRDLARRDFTVNAIALDLSPETWGQLIDPFDGHADLQTSTIRSLYRNSFADDPTRIFRAIRYSQRLGFHIARSTAQDITTNIGHIATLTSDRIIAEINKIHAETKHNEILTEISATTIMGKIHPALRWDKEPHAAAMRKAIAKNIPPPDAFLAIASYFLSDKDQIGTLTKRIANSSASRNILLQTASIRSIENLLMEAGSKPSQLHGQLATFDKHVLEIMEAITSHRKLAEVIHQELHEFRQMRPQLTAKDLLEMGVPQGPAIGDILETLHTTILDHPETDQAAETDLVRLWLQNNSPKQ